MASCCKTKHEFNLPSLFCVVLANVLALVKHAVVGRREVLPLCGPQPAFLLADLPQSREIPGIKAQLISQMVLQ